MTTKIAFYQSPVGVLEIRVDDEFITHILFKDEASTRSSSNHALLKAVVEQLQQYFKGERKIFDLPLKQSGSDFQQRVWNELEKIPFGKTISYFDLSKKNGDVKAIRAAASTNGKNNIAIVVPCHRVIGSDGSLTGYAGGLWRKQWLLDHERNIVSKQQIFFSFQEGINF